MQGCSSREFIPPALRALWIEYRYYHNNNIHTLEEDELMDWINGDGACSASPAFPMFPHNLAPYCVQPQLWQ